MVETWDEERLIADGFSRVYAELDWYDGPRAGLADIDGSPHYFDGYGQYLGDGADEYRVWPAGPEAAAWEREQWAIAVARNEAVTAGPECPPGRDGIDARHQELDALLAPHRRMPQDARRLRGEVRLETGARDQVDGVRYWIRWRAGG
ncbi:hypothetical protein [Streptomyces sp. NPDC000983]|uniref:hypothetical protein n=1 Tax=Streptomyces sp. NPDC000983 TaxID=3154373 RepID=UPI00331FC3AA